MELVYVFVLIETSKKSTHNSPRSTLTPFHNQWVTPQCDVLGDCRVLPEGACVVPRAWQHCVDMLSVRASPVKQQREVR